MTLKTGETVGCQLIMDVAMIVVAVAGLLHANNLKCLSACAGWNEYLIWYVLYSCSLGYVTLHRRGHSKGLRGANRTVRTQLS
jgi:hypothetical protein